MSNRWFRAELSTPVGGVVGLLEALTIEDLRKLIAKEWLPMLEDGDCVRIFETYED
jgi:hypothetical protein